MHLEKDVNMMAKCIQLDMACATLCYIPARLMSMGSEQLPRMHPCLHSLRGSLPENGSLSILTVITYR